MLSHVLNQEPPPPSSSSFEEPPMLSTPVGNFVVGVGGVIPLVGSLRKVQKALTILRYSKPANT